MGGNVDVVVSITVHRVRKLNPQSSFIRYGWADLQVSGEAQRHINNAQGRARVVPIAVTATDARGGSSAGPLRMRCPPWCGVPYHEDVQRSGGRRRCFGGGLVQCFDSTPAAL